MKVICFDLDDTLYKEIDYLKSAYKEIAKYAAILCTDCSDRANILSIKAYNRMLEAYYEELNAFEELNRYLGLNIPIYDYLYIYRNHKPKISLPVDIAHTFDILRIKSIRIGLITDGRSLQQRNKIEALELNNWIDDEDIIISEEFGYEKPSQANYIYFMKRYPECHDFTYVGDNLSKDFIAPNKLGWNTICLKDNGKNIHKQVDERIEDEMTPKMWIDNISDILYF